MTHDFIQNLQEEIALLEAELEHDPRWKKLTKLQEIMRLYVGRSGSRSEVGNVSHPRQAHGSLHASSNRAKAEELSEKFLYGRGHPTPTREIYNYLVSEGVEIGGKQPTSNLSAILSKNSVFKSIGRQGWMLSSEAFFDEEDGGSEVSADEGSSASSSVVDDLDLL